MKKFLQKPGLIGYTYSREEALKARENNQILAMRLETSLACNLKCKYCCNSSGIALEDEISFEKLIDLINEAKQLGAKSIVIIGGGEPTIYPKFKELIDHINKNELIPVVFTNTTTMTRELAEFLYKSNASVITKLDSLNEEIQDNLVGVKGTYQLIQKGIENLLSVGYGNVDDETMLRLGASFVVNRKNMKEVATIWRYCRERKIFPNLEAMIPNGFAKDLKDMYLRPEEWKNLRLELLKIDQNEFGYDWPPYLTSCNGCSQVFYNIYITVKGVARSCSCIHFERAGVNINVHDMTLKEIIQTPYFQKSRNIEKFVTGKCKKCKYNPACFGCRAMAFADGVEKGMSFFEALANEDPSCGFYEEN